MLNAMMMIKILVINVWIPIIMIIILVKNVDLSAMIVLLLLIVIGVCLTEKEMIVLVRPDLNLKKTLMEMNFLNVKKKLVEFLIAKPVIVMIRIVALPV